MTVSAKFEPQSKAQNCTVWKMSNIAFVMSQFLLISTLTSKKALEILKTAENLISKEIGPI